MYASVTPQFTRELLSPGLRVGYTDRGGVWQFLASSLSQRLPLRAIEWRNLVGVTKRIEQLPLHFVEISDKNDHSDFPLACIYVVKCEDLDFYKNTVRRDLMTWVDLMTSAKVEWLVLYVPLGTRPKGADNLPNGVYRKIFERLRTDFVLQKGGTFLRGTIASGQERICKLDMLKGTSVFGHQQQHEAQWTELLLRLRYCVMEAFERTCFEYEEKLRKLAGNRGDSNWNFGAFFQTKDQLASMYEQMYLQDDAIRHLDELEACFSDFSLCEKIAFQSNWTHTISQDDTIFTHSPLDIISTKTQELIAMNRASSQIVSLYCFCRQIRTLYVMGNFPQLLARGMEFIETFQLELQQLKETLKWYQPFLWAVGACLEIAYACELAYSGRDNEWKGSSVSMQATQVIPVEEMARGLGNLLYLARRILRKFACFRKDIEKNEFQEEISTKPWYQYLQHVFVCTDTTLYDQCLLEVSHLASMYFSQSGRHRFAVFLGQECAMYHLKRGEYESASSLLRSMARQSEEDGWLMIFRACVRTICRVELALGRSTEAVAACFNMLKFHEKDEKEEIKEFIAALVSSFQRPLNGQLNEKTTVNLQSLLNPTLAVETMHSSDLMVKLGEIRVSLNLVNDFSAALHIDQIQIRFQKLKEQTKDDEVTILFEENQVQINEKTNRKFVFSHSTVPLGHYSCTHVDCIIAGTQFPLLKANELIQASFEMKEKMQSLQLAIDGPHLFIPRPFASVEKVLISIQGNEEKVSNGTLEVCTLKPNSLSNEMEDLTHDEVEETSEDNCILELIQVDEVTRSSNVLNQSLDINVTCSSMTVELPTLNRGDYLLYLLTLTLSPFEESSEEAIQERSLTIRASVRYHQESLDSSTFATSTQVQSLDSTFRIIPPLTSVMRFKRVNSRLFTSIALTCNPFTSITLLDYRLNWLDNQFSTTSYITLEHDPNEKMRGTQLRPSDCIYCTFTHQCGQLFDDLSQQFDSNFELEFQDEHQTWKQTMRFEIPLKHVIGPQYQIHVHRKHDKVQDIESSTTDPIMFEIRIQENMSSKQQSETLVLCLTTRSKQDWILMGKEREILPRNLQSDPRNGIREFYIEKKFVATQIGRLRFPTFQLEMNGQLIPSSRVYCQQSSCQETIF
ncbi:Putative transmembrane protein [Plasmopara halstedii]|uniref:Putative transmembrane protein n=1 Tax=Plasmopara halstedii TaxID=4781 RepID=A0A0P1ALY5_PLAHL|nr:Putative transmembrane protein [Plasmopara halstedii]CEG41732.1 Putative transmembrane protein [Plasmopara halstedii]|eukprot:XP_024578101.1 Putative transmembrane protein [Plasmopara halstedii]